MTRIIKAMPLTKEAFTPFGEVIETGSTNHHYPINGGKAERYHALARVEAAGPEAQVLISTVRGEPYKLPLALTMVERHPLGSQAFIPLGARPFLVIVCPDDDGQPGAPHAFLTSPGQGVNYPRNLWHGVLTPLGAPQDFAVIDRGGAGVNLEEYLFDVPYEIHL